jgi:hypothetical protein
MNIEAEHLVARITEDLRRLRYIIEEPVSIKYGYDIPVDIEIRPLGDDDRVLVGCEGCGFTTVNYTSEGLILDVIPEGAIDILHTASFYKEDLSEEQQS